MLNLTQLKKAVLTRQEEIEKEKRELIQKCKQRLTKEGIDNLKDSFAHRIKLMAMQGKLEPNVAITYEIDPYLIGAQGVKEVADSITQNVSEMLVENEYTDYKSHLDNNTLVIVVTLS